MSNSQPNTIPTNTLYCKTITGLNDLIIVERCPYWRWRLNEEVSNEEGWVHYEGYCQYYKDWLLDDDVRLLECLAEWGLECLAEWGDDYE